MIVLQCFRKTVLDTNNNWYRVMFIYNDNNIVQHPNQHKHARTCNVYTFDGM